MTHAVRSTGLSLGRRGLWVWLHRWVGLTTAGFLTLVGLTGSLLAFQLEINALLTPELYPGPRAGVELDPATLARRAEASAPGARATTVYVGYAGTAHIGMEALPGASPLNFSSLLLDSITGEELGRKKWGGLPTTRAEVMPFIYNLHMALALGEPGEWVLGIVALLWTIDCFIAFYLTLPASWSRSEKGFLARWKRAWLIKSRSSFYRVNFDLHRASGLWLWLILLIFAWSSVSFNLNGLYTRSMSLFFDYEQPSWARASAPPNPTRRDALSWEEAQKIGRALMDEQSHLQNFTIERPLALYIIRDKRYCEYRVRSSRDIGDKAGMTSVYFDAYTGALQSVILPTGRRAGDTITTWLVELHTANLFGLPYKIFVCALGFVITMLSATGVYIWWKKRRARQAHVHGKCVITRQKVEA
jgi:uncharacterized iron-regulated membrane protein